MSVPPPSSIWHFGNTQGDAKTTLFCFSHLRWDFVFQRPQHLLTRAGKDFEVFYIEEPIFEEACRARLAVRQAQEGVTVVTPHLPRGLCASECIVTQRRLLNLFIAGLRRKPTIAWYYTPMALQFTDHIAFDCVVYDCMDELSNFKNAPSNLPDLEAQLFKKADLVFTGGRALFEAKNSKHGNIHAFPSSIDRSHFAKARAGGLMLDPVDQRHIAHPRIGFFGVIDERLDYELITEVARCKPDCHFVMLGPVVKIDPADLPTLPNIHWLGQKDYKDLPRYMANWDVGFMPFAINDATRFISPTKTPEFLAAGLPVVSTPVQDVVRSWGKPGLVSIASDAEAMCEQIDRAMIVDRSLWLKRVDQALSQISWDMTYAAMMRLINLQLPARKLPVVNVVKAEPSLGDNHV
jgi:glycosyltransferase involved in cell wall biosynthesis